MSGVILLLGLALLCAIPAPAVAADTTPPQLVEFDFTPKSVDVSTGSQTVTVTMRITDNDSGAQAPTFQFSSQSTSQSAGFGTVPRISGTANDGIYQKTITIPQGAAPGNWDAVLFPLRDTAGNSGSFGPPAGFPKVLSVGNTPADTTPPDTSIASGPSGTISSSSASFSFSATEAGSSFECKLDAGSWAACSSPRELTGLSEGSHNFSVRAKDAAGNTDASEATRSFTVDTTPPPPPDSDGDGVPNASDRCPTVAGSTAREGCPAPAPAPALSPTPIIPPTTAPSNDFRFTGRALVKRRLTVLTLTVPGPGVVTAAQAGTTGTGASATKPLIKLLRVTADAAGKLKLKIRPSKAGTRLMRKKRSFSVELKITYTPDGGTPRTSTKRVKVKR